MAWNQNQYDTIDYEAERTLVDGPLLLSGQVRQIEKPELLATFPPKPQVDKLVRHFFDRKNFAFPSFRRSSQPAHYAS
jgi:hypothetical protein